MTSLDEDGSRCRRDLFAEFDITPPDGPDDAGDLVGERDGGFVMPSATLDTQRPGSETVRPLFQLGRPEHRPGAMGQ